MGRNAYVIFLLLLVNASILSHPAFAAARQELSDDRIMTPESSFYRLKIAYERVRLAFTFGDGRKAGFLLDLADERLAEIAALARRNDTERMSAVQGEYDFIIGAYSALKKPDDARFASHVRMLDALAGDIENSASISERDRIYAGVIVANLRSKASTAGSVPPSKGGEWSQARLEAERAVDSAGEALGEYAVSFGKTPSASNVSGANATYSAALRLLENGDYIAAKSIAQRLDGEMRAELAAAGKT